jgi:hypothetical protein
LGEANYTEKTANEALQALLTHAREGTLPDSQQRSGHTFGEACSDWLRYVEHEKQRALSTVTDYKNVVNGSLLPEFERDTPIEQLVDLDNEGARDALRNELATASGCSTTASSAAAPSKKFSCSCSGS